MKGICCKCKLKKDVLFYKQIERETLCICHECLEKEQEKIKTTKFNLCEKRSELFEEMKLPLTTEDEEDLLIAVFSFVEQQDKEFIKIILEEEFEEWIKQLPCQDGIWQVCNRDFTEFKNRVKTRAGDKLITK